MLSPRRVRLSLIQNFSMANKRFQLGIIFLTVLIDLIGFGIVIPLMPIYADKFGASPLANGALLGVYSAAQLIFSPLWGKLSDRIGRRPVLITSVIGTAIGFFIMGKASVLWVLFLARIIDGISGGNISTAQAYIADITPPEKRSGAMGMIGAAFGLGFVFGPMLGGLLSHISLAAPFYFAAGLATLNALLIFLVLPESLAPENRSGLQPKQSIMDVFGHANGTALGTVMVIYFLSITGFAMMTGLNALFLEKRFGFDVRHIGFVWAYIGILGVIIQGGLLGRLVRRFGEKPLATVGAFVLALSLFLLPLCSQTGMLLWVCLGLAIGNGFLTPTLNGLASLYVDKTWQGRALGLMQSSGSLGRAIGPVIAGYLLQLGSNLEHRWRTPFWASSLLLMLTFVLMLTVSRTPVGTTGRQ